MFTGAFKRMESVSTLLKRLHSAAVHGDFDTELFRALIENSAHMNECEVVDFKRQAPTNNYEYSKLVRDLVALHNSFGGFLVFGVGETSKDREFTVCGVPAGSLDIAKVRDQIKSHCGVDVRTSISTISFGEFLVEILWIHKRTPANPPLKFISNGPEGPNKGPSIKKGDIVFRRISSNSVAQKAEDYEFLYSERLAPTLSSQPFDYTRLEPTDNNLPDRAVVCSNFVGRSENIAELWSWLGDDFSRVRLIAGEGGLGKTSLAYQFSEDVAKNRVKPYAKVVWLTAKAKQFNATKNEYVAQARVDFNDANSLFKAIGVSLGLVEIDFADMSPQELMRAALDSCNLVPCFLVIDDVDSLSNTDQLRVLEFGMRAPGGTKILLTTRVNFSYSPDNVLKLNGLQPGEYKSYVVGLRSRYVLPAISDGKIEQLRGVSGGSPLYTDSLLRLERRGVLLDKSMVQWKDDKGLEVRRAALSREVAQLSREAKRTLFTISTLRSCSYLELSQVVNYSEQTLGDALQELSGLFLISAPPISTESRYTVEPNTGLLVLEIAASLDIDHTALAAAAKKPRSDAIALTSQRRNSIVALAISEANAQARSGDGKAALDVVKAASRKLSKPNADLLLAEGRFSLKLSTPNLENASRSFSEAYKLGQRKPLLFALWFESEMQRGTFEDARDISSNAIDHGLDRAEWLERKAQAHAAMANRAHSRFSNDAAIREVESAITELREAKLIALSEIQRSRLGHLIRQAVELREGLRRRS